MVIVEIAKKYRIRGVKTLNDSGRFAQNQARMKALRKELKLARFHKESDFAKNSET